MHIGASVEVLVNDDNLLCGLYFQDENMKHVFAAYPELVCMDATYKLVVVCSLFSRLESVH